MSDLRTVDVGGLTLAYRVAGDPRLPAVLLLHALGEDGGSWAQVTAAISDSWRTYALDLRGHGHSDRPGRYSFELMRDDVVAFLDALGLPPVTVVGHSMGATVGYLLAQRHPDRVARLVLEEPPPPLPPVPARTVPEPTDEEPGFDWAVVAPLYAQRNNPDPAWWDRLTAITAPTLVIAGGQPSHLPQDQIADLAARIPDSRLITIPAGHFVHTASPETFLAAMRAFVDGWAGMPRT